MKYRTIVADPPWQVARVNGGYPWNAGLPSGSSMPLDYPTMTYADIALLPVGQIADDSAHLYLWTTNHRVPLAYKIVEAWGFKPSILLTWAKSPKGFGNGDAFAITTEHIIFAHRGGLRPLRRVETTWWNWKRGRHSAKPEAFLDMVESVSPGPYLEMFARRQRLGWDTYGLECFTPPELAGNLPQARREGESL